MSALAVVAAVLRSARARARREDGAVALATLAFMMVTGMVAVVSLWTIGYATGAYNELYSASQTAAYAAATRTKAAEDNQQAQLDFDCARPSAGSSECTGGSTLQVAQAVLDKAFPDPGAGAVKGFGLTYQAGNAGSTVRLVDAQFASRDVIYAFYVPMSSGAAQRTHGNMGFPACPAYDRLGRLVCWNVTEQANDTAGAVGGEPRFTSGVIVRTAADVKIPACRICGSVPLQVTTSARQEQVSGAGNE